MSCTSCLSDTRPHAHPHAGWCTHAANRLFHVAALVIVASHAWSQDVPDAINYQGYITEGGTELTGAHQAAFWLYTSETGEEPDKVWGPQTFQVEFLEGRFNVTLSRDDAGLAVGDVLTSTAFPDGCWLEIKIDTNSPMPRQRLVSAPFSLVAPGVVPIGAIVPWHKSLPGTPPLPPGWVECNGQVLNDSASPFHGQTVPDLNSTGRFLRGGTTSGIEQDDAVQDHGHVPGSLNIADSGAHSHSLDKYKLRNGSGFLAEAVADNAGDYAGTRNTATATHGHPAGSFAGNTGSPTAGTRTDVETRPVNMSVVWIIRVR